MLLKLLVLAAVCALVVYFYLRFSRPNASPRLRPQSASAPRVAAGAPAAGSPPDRRGVLDLFLFEQSFGWELARVLTASLPVVLALLAIYWLVRNAQ